MVSGQNDQLCARYACRDQLGVLLPYHIVRARHYQHGHIQLFKLLRGYIRLVHHKAEHLRLCLCIAAERRKKFHRIVAQLYWPLYSALYSGRIQVCTVYYQLFYHFGVLERKCNRDIAAIRKAQYVRLFYSMLSHEAVQVVGKALYGEFPLPPGRSAMPSGVYSYDAVILCKAVCLMFKIAVLFTVAVEHYKRKSAAFFLIVK